MFVSVKDLTKLIDTTLKYLDEAYETKEDHDAEVFDLYVESTNAKLRRQFKKLCEISSNQKLIETYRKKIETAIK